MLFKRSKPLFILGFATGLLLAVFVIRLSVLNQPTSDFHEHADFALFLNGERFDFERPEFMSIENCEVTWNSIPSAYAHEGEYTGDVHLHDGNGNIIHAHAPGITYEDFFAAINISFDNEKFIDHQGNIYENNQRNIFRMFLNGAEISDLFHQEIRDLDRVLITYGSRFRSTASINAELVQVTSNACIASGKCPHRGVAPPESCGSATKTPFLIKLIGL